MNDYLFPIFLMFQSFCNGLWMVANATLKANMKILNLKNEAKKRRKLFDLIFIWNVFFLEK